MSTRKEHLEHFVNLNSGDDLDFRVRFFFSNKSQVMHFNHLESAKAYALAIYHVTGNQAKIERRQEWVEIK